jgi:hypothetical protein
MGVTYVSHPAETDPSKVKGYTKATTRFEYRVNKASGTEKVGYLTANKLFYQLDEDLSALIKVYLSRTKNETTDDIEAQFKELSVGLAYRPVRWDKYALLGKIAYLEDQSPLAQSDPSLCSGQVFAVTRSGSFVTSLEGSVDLPNRFQIVEKLAWKRTVEDVAGCKAVASNTYLIATRLNYYPSPISSPSRQRRVWWEGSGSPQATRGEDKERGVGWLQGWRIGVEYRMLVAQLAEDRKAGFVLEFDREVQKYVYLGFGYNFTDFSDDLTEYKDDYKINGFFIRVTAKY